MDIITAKEAQLRTAATKEKKKMAELNHCFYDINEAINKGKSSTTLRGEKLSGFTIQELERLGFKVTVEEHKYSNEELITDIIGSKPEKKSGVFYTTIIDWS